MNTDNKLLKDVIKYTAFFIALGFASIMFGLTDNFFIALGTFMVMCPIIVVTILASITVYLNFLE